MSNHQKRYDAICIFFYPASVFLMMCPSRVELRDESHSVPLNEAKIYFYNLFLVRSWREKSFSSHFHPLRFFSIGANVRSTILLWFNISPVWFLELYFFFFHATHPHSRFSRLNGKSIFLLLTFRIKFTFLGNFYLCACLD